MTKRRLYIPTPRDVIQVTRESMASARFWRGVEFAKNRLPSLDFGWLAKNAARQRRK